MRKFAAVLAVTALMSFAVPTAANAGENYTPTTPPGVTLSGSAVDPSCGDGNATIVYSVTLNDPNNASTGANASLRISRGTNSTVLSLGSLVNNHLEGSIAWPAAAWTRTGNVDAQLEAGGATLAVPLVYEPATVSSCFVDPAVARTTSASLASTGMSSAVLPIGLAAVALIVAGVGIALARRFARR